MFDCRKLFLGANKWGGGWLSCINCKIYVYVMFEENIEMVKIKLSNMLNS